MATSPVRMVPPIFYSPSPTPSDPGTIGDDSTAMPTIARFKSEKELFAASREVSLYTEDVLPETAKTVGKIIKAWQDYAYDRFGSARERLTNAKEEEKEPLRVLLREDRKCLDEYIEVVKRIAQAVTDILKGGKSQVRILFNSDKAPLSMSSYSTDGSSLYIDLIATAPSNLKMNIPNHDGRTPSKGAGTILLHSLYTTAQKIGLGELYLKPLSGSASFYEHLGMKRRPDKDEFYFVVDPKTSPEKLLRSYRTFFSLSVG